MTKEIEEWKKLRQEKIEIAQKVYAIVNYNLPPDDDAGTIQNVVNLVDDLNDYVKHLTEIDPVIDQRVLSI
jgi:hypothetical protein